MWNVIKGVVQSRKNVLAILAVAAMIGGRFGYNWSAETMFVVVSPFLMAIFGIAYEDGQAKRAGAGTTTTATPTADGGVEVRAVPDAAGEP